MDVSKTISDVDSNLISNNLNAPADSSAYKKTTTKNQYFLRTREIKKQGTDDKKAKKKLLHDKKFPLMEKSQRNLMHLKHNREVPKPRAHMASHGISPVCGYTKSGTSKKVENNSKKTATSPRKSTADKSTETKRKVGRPRLLANSNKVSATRDNSKSEIGNKVGNTSRKVSPYESMTAAYKVSEWLDNYFKGSTHENTKDGKVIFICRNKTFVTKKCSCPPVKDINDDIRNEFRDSETSDSEYEKFVESQKEAMNLKKRGKKQPTSTRKKIQKKSKRKNAKKDAEVSSESESESYYNVRSKKCKKRNKCTNDKSRQKSGKNNTHLSKDECESEYEEFKDKSRKKNNTPLPEDESESEFEDFKAKSRKKNSTPLPDDESQSELEEFKDKSRKKNSTPLPEDESQSEYEDYDDNCVYIRNSSSENMSDNEVNNNLPIKSPQKKSENERVLISEMNSFAVTDSNVLVASNPNLNISSESTEEKTKNEHVLTSEINALGAKNEISDELSVITSKLVSNFSHANNTEKESPENPIVIDLSLDDECESAKSTAQFISSDKTVVTETITTKSQSDDESDLEIVDVVLSYEKLKETIATADSNLTVKKETKAIVKHEAAFSTDICTKLSETNSEYVSLDHKVHNTIEKKVNKKEECDEDIIVLSDEKVFTDISNSSRTALNAGTSREENAIGEISTCKKERSLENLTDEAESMSSREKLLYEVACSNLKVPTTDNKPTKFSCLSPDDMTNMDVNSMLQMFKTEFQNYREILEVQESIIYTFKLLENRQAEKLLSLKSAIKRYIESFGCSDKKVSILDSPTEKIEFGDSRLLERNPGVSSMNAISVCNAEGVERGHFQESRNSSQDSLLPLSSIHQRDRSDDSKLQSTFGSDQKFKEHSNEMPSGKKCIVCSEDAVTACQQCFKVFFCSNKCRKTYWDDGHGRVCRI